MISKIFKVINLLKFFVCYMYNPSNYMHVCEGTIIFLYNLFQIMIIVPGSLYNRDNANK